MSQMLLPGAGTDSAVLTSITTRLAKLNSAGFALLPFQSSVSFLASESFCNTGRGSDRDMNFEIVATE